MIYHLSSDRFTGLPDNELKDHIINYWKNIPCVSNNLMIDSNMLFSHLEASGHIVSIGNPESLKKFSDLDNDKPFILSKQRPIFGFYNSKENKILLDENHLSPESIIEQLIYMQSFALRSAARQGVTQAFDQLKNIELFLGKEINEVIHGRRSVVNYMPFNPPDKLKKESVDQYRTRLIDEARAKTTAIYVLDAYKKSIYDVKDIPSKNTLKDKLQSIVEWVLIGKINEKSMEDIKKNPKEQFFKELTLDLLDYKFFNYLLDKDGKAVSVNINPIQLFYGVSEESEAEKRMRLIEETVALKVHISEQGGKYQV